MRHDDPKDNKVKNLEKSLLEFHLKGKIDDIKGGAYGIVYIVDKERGYPRCVAYKTTKDVYDEEKLKAFVREAKIWFEVKGHSLILTPFYITYFKNRPLICMPYCEKSLRDYLEERGKLDPIEALVIVAQLLKGLIFAKSKGIEAHQDLKPENILLEDLSKKFVDWPPEGLEPLKWKVRIADFGSANAWRELGKPGGTKPYMAPEQWNAKKEYDKYKRIINRSKNFSKVDVFAVGIILYELLTGKHPVGVRISDVWPEPREGFSKRWKKDDKWKKWAKSPDKDIKVGDNELSIELEEFIKQMLCENSNERISIEQAFDKTMYILRKINKPIANQLELLFEYYDSLARYCEDRDWLRSLAQITQLPEQLDVVIEQLLEEISKVEKHIDSSSKAVYFCELCYITSNLLLKRQKLGDDVKVKDLAEKIILTAVKWKTEIKTYHKYPELKFKGFPIITTPSFRDFEIYAELIGYSRKLLEKVQGEKETKKIFEKLDNYTKSAYFYSIASEYHFRGLHEEAIKTLDKCIELNPKEAVFYYMKALWTDQYLRMMDLLEKELNGEKRRIIEKSILENVKMAIQIAPDWKEPKEFYIKFQEFQKSHR
ncbi:Serine/threonine protein kinase [Geoglobus ahangari]|uniref:Serine/threonine protein kinase n=1 Tax=Geoglobus ahangari TaxID=113653 RepID=A0A0F7DBW6_9EURY|nr:protein kinase [Geoglobus ahangari]AKG91806.1 Serine/threonine protein kinase [Geoglobus ahangari]